MSGYIGQEVSRVDGPAKVTGSARYSGEIPLPGLACAQIVGAGRGGYPHATQHPRVNWVPLVPSLLGSPAPGETFFPMQDDVIHYAGQPVAVVVADTLEQAQHAATLVQVGYAEMPSVTVIDQGRGDAYEPEKIFGGLIPGTTRHGNVEDGLASADTCLDATFRFAANHHNPLEALTTVAAWDDGQLTLYDSCQGIKAVQLTVAALLGISPSRIRVLTRYIGGAFGASSRLYASPAYEGVHRLVRGNTMTPTFTRAPGEAVGIFTLECAMDELASQLKLDPIELRLRNLTEIDPVTQNPWSSYGLRECLRRGAERIGWASRDPRPGAERDGNWLIGTGMAVAAYPAAFFMRTQRARAHLYADGTAIVQTSAQEFGTGTPTVLTQVAADALWVSLGDVRLEFGDTNLGRWANVSLGDYLVPVNADAPDVDVELIEVEDHVAGPLGVKGVAEIGQVGSGAAIANAVYHATGYRPRELPIAVEHLLAHLPAAAP